MSKKQTTTTDECVESNDGYHVVTLNGNAYETCNLCGKSVLCDVTTEFSERTGRKYE